MVHTRELTPRDRRNDLVLAGVMFVGGIISAALSAIAGIYDDQAPLWEALVYIVVISAPLAVRRRWPAPVAVIVSTAYFLAVTLRIPELYAGNIAMFIGLYTVGAWMTNRRAAMLTRIGIITGMFAWLLGTMYWQATTTAQKADVAAGLMSPYVAIMMLQVFINLLYFGGAYYFGERSWNQAVQQLALRNRTVELEREREVTAAQAVALDRVRIARELHDVVAHHVSVMGVQAGAARVVMEKDPAEAAVLLGGVEQSAREALGELHNLLETLRTPDQPDPEEASTLGIDDISDLVAAANDAGLPTSLEIVGDPAPAPSVVEVNLYRIAQESLTNARRHAGLGATADVRVRYGDGDIELEVVNTGRRVFGARSGLGQLGMRERALASGGSIEIGPRERGGWRVRTRIPLTAEVPS